MNRPVRALLLAGGLAAVGPGALAADAPAGWPRLKAAPAADPAWVLCRKGAAEPISQKFPDVPGDDIFGFTSPTDLGKPGECGLAFEYSAAAGKANGRYIAGFLKMQFDATIAENFNVAVSPFVTHHQIRGVTALDDRDQVRFDGVSTELSYRFLERSAANRIAATFAVEPRWARWDGAGLPVTAYWIEFKLLVDSVIVADRLYAAMNLNYAPAIQRPDADPLGRWMRFSATSVSGALTYQINDRWFIGGEIRHLMAFEGAALERKVGEALFAGPTILVKLSDAASFNVAWTPQLRGHALGSNRQLDLDIFERHHFRVKLATYF